MRREAGGLAFGGFDHQGSHFGQAGRIAVFVVVPGGDGDQRAVEHLGQRQVDDGGVRIADDARGGPLAFKHFHDALERGFVGSVAEGLLDLVDGDGAVEVGIQLDDRAGAGGHAVGFAGDVQVGPDELERFGRAGRRGDDVLGGSPRVAPVFHGLVGERLGVGVGVDGGKEAGFDAEAVAQDFNDRGQGVGGAACHADDALLGGVEGVGIDAGQEHRVGVIECLGRGGEQDVLRAAIDVLLRRGTGGGAPGAFDHQVDTQRGPVGDAVFDVQVLDGAVTDFEIAVFRGYFLRPHAVVGVDLEQGAEGVEVFDVADDLGDPQVLFEGVAQGGASDPPEAVECD